MINQERLVNLFKELVSIDSPSYQEKEMAERLKVELKDLGFEIYQDNAGEKIGGNTGNIYAYLDGDVSLEPLLFCAHMDTVEPSKGKIAVVHDDGKITSAGDTVLGSDDVAGLASILEAVRTIKENNLSHRPIEILFTIVEEKYCEGVKEFDFSKIKSKEAYILDLSGPVGPAANQAPTVISYKINIKGKAAHAGFEPEKGVHAIVVAANAISKMKMGHVDFETVCNIGTINGGLAFNIVPEDCYLVGEIRSFSHQKALDLMQEVKDLFEESAREKNAQVNFDIEICCEAYKVDPEHRVIKRYESLCKEMNLPYELCSTLGASDNNHMAKMGINGLVIATAMNNCHSCNEFTTVSELNKIGNLTLKLMTSKE